MQAFSRKLSDVGSISKSLAKSITYKLQVCSKVMWLSGGNYKRNTFSEFKNVRFNSLKVIGKIFYLHSYHGLKNAQQIYIFP